MKKNLLLLLSFLIAQNAFSQVYVGIKGGLSVSNILFPQAKEKVVTYTPEQITVNRASLDEPNSLGYLYFDYESDFFKMFRERFQGGLFVQIPMKKYFDFLQIALNYEQKGFYLDSQVYKNSPIDRTHESFVRDIRNDYVVLPITFGKYLSAKKHLFYEVGIYTAYLVSSKFEAFTRRKIFPNGTDDFAIYSTFIKSEQEKDAQIHNRFDAGLCLGLGYQLDLNEKLSLIANFRTNVGLLRLSKYGSEFKKEPIPSTSGFDYLLTNRNYFYGLNAQARNLSFNLSVGLMYRLQ